MYFSISNSLLFLFFVNIFSPVAYGMEGTIEGHDKMQSRPVGLTLHEHEEVESIDKDTHQTIVLIPREDALVFTRMKINQDGKRNYGYIYENGFKAIHPDFVQYVISKGGKFLEIGAARGNTLKIIYDLQKNAEKKKEITYVLNEINVESQEYLQKNFSSQENITPTLSKADGVEHVNNLKNKETYEAIYAGMVAHFFPPMKYIRFLVGCNAALKMGGKLYYTQNIYDWPYNDLARIDYDTNKKKSQEFPGYFFSEKAASLEVLFYIHESAKQHAQENREKYNELFMKAVSNPHIIKYQPLHYHDQDTIKPLLVTCGFKINKCHNYKETYKDGNILRYVGIIAEKAGMPNEEGVKKLMASGEKVEQAYAEYRKNLSSILQKNIPDFLQSTRYN